MSPNILKTSWRVCGFALLAWSFVTAAPALDTLTLVDGSTIQGTFLSFKAGQFEMRALNASKPSRTALTRVTALALDPPVTVDVRSVGGKRLENPTFSGYAKPNFAFTTADGEVQVLGMRVSAVTAKGGDMQREMAHVADADRAMGDTAPHDADFRIAIHTGVCTVVQFHMPSVVSSVRQGNYVAKRCADSKGKIAYQRVELTGWDDPAAVRYKITSAPQFWFFNRTGERVVSLTERFTDADIDAAFNTLKREH